MRSQAYLGQIELVELRCEMDGVAENCVDMLETIVNLTVTLTTPKPQAIEISVNSTWLTQANVDNGLDSFLTWNGWVAKRDLVMYRLDISKDKDISTYKIL